MDASETLARAYLDSLGCGAVVYEPDGRIPPDFAVGDIGVEVRRLNQNHEAGGRYEGLETAQASLVRFVEKLLPAFGPPKGGNGWWVFFYFWRPLDGKAIKRSLPKALAAFQASPVAGGGQIWLTKNFELEIRPAGIPVANYFMLGGFADRDQGGFVASEIIRNLKLCIDEKAEKIAPYQSRYREWWLVLPDHIGPNLDANERNTIGEHVDLRTFSRVVLIHPQTPTNALVISRPGAASGLPR